MLHMEHHILGIERGVTIDEVRRAYYNRMREYHPDRHAMASKSHQRVLHDMVHLVQEAYVRILRAEERRRQVRNATVERHARRYSRTTRNGKVVSEMGSIDGKPMTPKQLHKARHRAPLLDGAEAPFPF